MQRRTLLKLSLATALRPVVASAAESSACEAAAEVLQAAVKDGSVHAAALSVRRGDQEFSRAFGEAGSVDRPFLLGSITKPICMAALMTLFDEDRFELDDPVHKYLPEFTSGNRRRITIRQLLTHTSGLPDQLPENDALRRSHAGLDAFVAAALKTPLLFAPGEKYSYSSMGILLASEIAERLSGMSIHKLTAARVFRPLEMQHSALGLGRFQLQDLQPCQTEQAAPESGAGDPSAREWDWNSPYWRKLGAPWGTAHCSAPDVARFLAEFLHATGKAVQPETARLMRRNHNREGTTPRGLGFAIGPSLAGEAISSETFGHTGSTGTLAWADPHTDTVCVVLTSLPGRARDPHPRRLASDQIAKSHSAK